MSSFEWKILHSASISTPPSTSELSDGFTITAPLGTDLWETSTAPPVFNCPMIYKSMPLSSFRRARVTVTANIKTLYAQGGLAFMLRRTDGTRAWIKTGVEFIDGQQMVCVVGKDQAPDWSPGSTIVPQEPGVQEREVTVEISREEGGLAVFEISEGGEPGSERRKMIRELAWVLSPTGDEHVECWVGAYAAKPLGKEGDGDLVVRFRRLSVEATE
ncbi:DUF1349 domain-containing protein [Aspergillus stella-maris]|uniref:DUF1349 domain-containing protein n=1 Tax=Aspergillus stella-maris TaxID=1810926 RepID=UPI003CCD8449